MCNFGAHPNQPLLHYGYGSEFKKSIHVMSAQQFMQLLSTEQGGKEFWE
jgi:hypothetical protein